MKLYATLKNERGGRKSTSDNTRILIELSYGNKVVGEVGLYAIIDDSVEGYRVVWNDPEKGYSSKNVLKEVETGKTQQGINRCGHKDTTNTVHGKYCLDCHAYL